MSTVTLTVERDVSHHKDDTARRVIVTLPAHYAGFTGELMGVLPFTSIAGSPTQIQLNLDDPRHMLIIGNILPELVLRNIASQLNRGQKQFEVLVEAVAYNRFIQGVQRQFG